MRKLIAIELAVLIALLGFIAGRIAGVRHCIDSMQVFAIEHDLDAGYRVFIDVNGQVHEYHTN